LTAIKKRGDGRTMMVSRHGRNSMAPKALRSAQLDILKRAIARRYAEMLAETREDVERAREETFGALAGPVTDEGDRAAADLLADLDQAEISRDLREMKNIEAALTRIREGTFGSCADCGAEIEIERLRAYPIALRCLRCQSTRERTYAHAAGPRL
jgi:RNA polymerase-binding protein DksA